MTNHELLTAALRRDWRDLSLDTGRSPTTLAQLALQAIDDPRVIAAYPVECRILAARRHQSRAARTRKVQT